MNQRIKEARKEKSLTQKALAEELGITSIYMNMIETGKKEPSDRTIKDICRILEINETWLRTGEGDMHVKISKDAEAARLAAMYARSDDPDYRAIMRVVSRITPEAMEIVRDFCKSFLEEQCTEDDEYKE